jgi:hypothetical protein
MIKGAKFKEAIIFGYGDFIASCNETVTIIPVSVGTGTTDSSEAFGILMKSSSLVNVVSSRRPKRKKSGQ